MKTHTSPIRHLCKTIPMLALFAGYFHLAAADKIYETGSSASATITAVSDNDTILLSGQQGSMTVDGITYSISDSVITDAMFNIGNKEGLTFKSQSYDSEKWSMMKGTGTYGMILIAAVSSTRTLTLDRVIVTGGGVLGNTGGGMRVQGGADTALLVKGDVMFVDNVAEQHGAAVVSGNSVIFEGTTVFSGNKAGYRNSTGRFETARHGGAYYSSAASNLAVVRFKENALFASNTTTASGGAIFMSAGNSLIFEKNAIFKNNESGVLAGTSYSGGGVYISATSKLIVDGTAIFDGNRTRNGGGGLTTLASATIQFNGDAVFTGNLAGLYGASVDGGGLVLNASATMAVNGNLTVSDNRATRYGGGLFLAGNATFSDTPGAYVLITDNFVGNTTDGAGRGGGIYTGTYFSLNRDFVFTGNQALDAGGGLFAKGAELSGSGTITGNVAGGNAGAIWIEGAGQGLTLSSNTIIENNVAGGSGGALYFNYDDAFLTLNASSGDIVFRGNKSGVTIDDSSVATGGTLSVTAGSGVANAVHFEGLTGTITVNAAAGQRVSFYDPVSTSSTTTLTVMNEGDGTILFDTYHTDIVADTTVTRGAFALANEAIYGRTGTGSFTVSSSGTLSGNGELRAKTVTIADGATLKALQGGLLRIDSTTLSQGSALTLAGSGTIDTGLAFDAQQINIGELDGKVAETLVLANNMTLRDSALLQYDLFKNNESDQLRVTGDIAFSTSSSGTINIGWSAAGEFEIISWTGAGITNTGSISLLYNGAAATARNEGALGITATSLILSNTTYSLEMNWTGDAGDGVWTTALGTSANWSDGGGVAEKYFRNGDRVIFGATGSGTVTVAQDGVIVSEMNVMGAQDYTFTGGDITVTGSSAGAHSKISPTGTMGKLIKTDAGSLVFSNSGTNYFESGIDMHGGLVAFSSKDQLQLGTGSRLTVFDSSTLRADASIAGISGTLMTNMLIETGKTLTFDTQGFEVEYAGNITSGATSSVLRKTGTGTLVMLSDNNSFSGTLNIAAGRFMLGSTDAKIGGSIVVASGATLSGIGNSTNASVFINGGVIDVGSSAASAGTLTFNSIMLDSGTLQFTLFQGGVSDQLQVVAPANATIGASGTGYINIFADFSSPVPVDYTLGNLANLYGKLGIKVAGETLDSTSRQEASLRVDSNNLILSYGTDKSRYMTWSLAGSVNGIWSEGASNWLDYGETSVKNKFLGGDTVKFEGAFSSMVTIDTGGGAFMRVSDMLVNNTGTLTFVGSGIYVSATTTSVGIAAPSGKLIKYGAGELAFANAANYFENGIEMSEGAIAFSNAFQLNMPSTTAITFTGDAMLRVTDNAGTVTSAMEIGSKIITLDTQGFAVALSGAITGSGTFVKIGAGVLAYSDTNALGHAATRINEGLVKLDVIASPAGVSLNHVFELNGGWLDLSDTPESASTNIWNLVINGTNGGVIGSNDQINIGTGNIDYQIGGAADDDKGVYVVVVSTGGTATFSRANNYVGYTRIDSGVLRVSADEQLGDATMAREIILNGGALHVADSFETLRQIELRASGSLVVADGKTTSWAGTRESGGSFEFTKDGEGTLILAGAMGHTGGTIVKSGTLEGSAGNLSGKITTDATLVLHETGSSVFSGTVLGTGVFSKTGTGVISPDAAASVNVATVRIDEGILLNTRDGAFTATSEFIIGSSGILAGGGSVNAGKFVNRGQIIAPRAAAMLSGAGAQDYGRLSLHGDYTGDGGTVILAILLQDNLALQADQLVISGSANGSTKISLLLTGTAFGSGTNTPLVVAERGATNTAFTLDKRYVSTNGRDLDLYYSSANGTFSLDYAVISPEVPAITGADITAILINRASMNSLANRMLAARLNETPRGFQLWTQGLYRKDKMKDTLYDGATIDTKGIQVGGDFVTGNDNHSITVGVFYDYAKADTDLSGNTSKTKTESNGAGAYIDFKAGNFHIGAIARGARENYDICVPATPAFSMDGNSWSAAIEIGYLIKGNSEWNVEPQVQFTYQTHNIDDAVDSFDRRFSLDSVDSLEGRAGVLIWQEYAWFRDLLIKPWIRASAVSEFKGKGRLHISERYSIEPSKTYENNFSGGYGIFDAGFSLEVDRGINIYGEGSWYMGGKAEGYSFNLGCSYTW